MHNLKHWDSKKPQNPNLYLDPEPLIPDLYKLVTPNP